MTFETKLTELQTLIKELETGEQPLNKSIKAYKNGQKLLQECRKYLEEAEMDVQKIMDAAGTTEPFTP